MSYDRSSLDATFLNSLAALTEGETLTDSFVYAIRLGNGTLSWATVTLEFSGANDAPTLLAAAASAEEDGPAISIDLSALGNDVDSDDDGTTLTYTISGLPTEGSASIDGTTLYFAPGNDFQYLAAGETRDVVVQITATDSHGATATNDMTITVTGTNDTPVITGGVFSGDVTTKPASTSYGPLTSEGTLSFADVDLSDTHLASVQSAASGTTYGTLTVAMANATDSTGENGQIQWSYAVDNSALTFLAAGQTHTDRFTITVDDQQGGTVSQDVEVTITGGVNSPIVSPLSVSTSEDKINGKINSILFVDDSGTTNALTWKNQWFSALTATGYSYDQVTLIVNGHPAVNLNNYDLVIWSVSDRAYTNLTAQNVAGLSSYLDQGGRLLYAGGHSVYQEPNLATFASQYLGISNYHHNMPSMSSAGLTASGPDGNYTLLPFAGAIYGGTMMSAFTVSGPNATSLMKLNNWTAGRNDIATINDNGTFVTATWGFDLAQLAPANRTDFLDYTLAEMGGKKFSFDLLSGATDPDGGTLNVSNLSQLSGPTISANVDANGVLSFTPGSLDFLDAGESIDLVYQYDVSNASASTSNTVTITIVGVPDGI